MFYHSKISHVQSFPSVIYHFTWLCHLEFEVFVFKQVVWVVRGTLFFSDSCNKIILENVLGEYSIFVSINR